MNDEGNLDEGGEDVEETAESGEVVDPEVVDVAEAVDVADAVEVTEPVQAALPPDFAELNEPVSTGEPGDLATLYDLTMPVAIELGRTSMSVQEILALGRGSVVQLDRLAGEPIDVFVGDRRFAEGEVVIVGEQFGVRITRIVQSAASEIVS